MSETDMSDKGKIILKVGALGAGITLGMTSVAPIAISAAAVSVGLGAAAGVYYIGKGIHNYLSEADNNRVNVLEKGSHNK